MAKLRNGDVIRPLGSFSFAGGLKQMTVIHVIGGMVALEETTELYDEAFLLRNCIVSRPMENIAVVDLRRRRKHDITEAEFRSMAVAAFTSIEHRIKTVSEITGAAREMRKALERSI